MTPRARRAWDSETLAEDAFSLIVKRSVTHGLVDLGGLVCDCPQWAHADAGGDWEPDGRERLLGWLQAYVKPMPGRRSRRLPIHPAVEVIRAALERVGTIAITQVDALLPLHATRKDPSPIADTRDWFGSPDVAKSPTPIGVVLDWGERSDAVAKAPDISMAANEIVGDVLMTELASPDEAHELMSVRQPFAGRTPGRHAATFCATAPEWSSDLAAWLVELFAYACLACQVETETLVAVRAIAPAD